MNRLRKKGKSEDVGDFDIPPSDDEGSSGEENEDDEDIPYKVPDHADQVELDPPVKYTAVKKGIIRIEAEMSSEKVSF